MRPTKTRSLLAVAVALAASGCTGTDTGNPYTQPLTVDAHSSDPSTIAVTTAEGGGVVAEAWLSLDHMAFVADGEPGCAAGEIGTDAALDLGVADHAVAGGTRLDINLTAGDYCTLAVPFALSGAPLPAGAPAELEGASIALTGTTAAGTEFVLASGLEATFALRGDGPLALDEELGALFLGFDVATWLEGVDIDSAAGAGTVIIDAATNADLLAAFEANVGAGIELYIDGDGDGAAGPGEPRIAAGR